MFSNLLVNARHRFQFHGIPYVIIVALYFGSLYNQGAFCELAFVFGIGFCLEFTSFAYDGLIFEISFCCSVTCILLYIIISLSRFYLIIYNVSHCQQSQLIAILAVSCISFWVQSLSQAFSICYRLISLHYPAVLTKKIQNIPSPLSDTNHPFQFQVVNST